MLSAVDSSEMDRTVSLELKEARLMDELSRMLEGIVLSDGSAESSADDIISEFGIELLDAESRVGRMLDELMRSLEQDHLHQEGKIVVEVMTKSIKPESLKRAIQSVEERRLPLFQRCDKPQVPRREGGRENVVKNNGRVAGKAETIMLKTAKKGCLKCGEMSHRDVLLDSGSDETVVMRGVMDAGGVKTGTVHSVPHLAYRYGSDDKPVVVTRSVKLNCVKLDSTCVPLVLRGLKVWVDDASTDLRFHGRQRPV
ncbi:hypothetical protein DYB37_012063 [Aphanomyces astaci]|uniref:Peptidase A2 domain-containing protein n=1 Tax=Aphanomyces astaci TaxID=112090 RepID=A0A418FJZ8_APHAT|nr:hypothetical protein DYB37_012063 [Aphanomyces astaci]